MNTNDKIEHIKFLQRNIGDWSEENADWICKVALEALTPAPNVPTRDQIASLIDKEAFWPLDSTTDYPRWINERAFRQENAYRKTDAILALFTPSPSPEHQAPRLSKLNVNDVDRLANTYFPPEQRGET